MKTKCELCKCLNLIAEGKKHPSISIWLALSGKWFKILHKDAKSLETFCDNHRIPLKLNADLMSVGQFCGEVVALVEKSNAPLAPAMLMAKGGDRQ